MLKRLQTINIKKFLGVAIIGSAVSLFFILDLNQYLNLIALQQSKAALSTHVDTNPAQSICLFFVLYVAIAGLSLPGSAIMSLCAGALFGIVTGTLITSFASVSGACIAFLSARWLLQDKIQHRFSTALVHINKGIQQDGVWYLMSIRLVPVFPFFIVNLLMGVTTIKLHTFAWVSQIGMLPATLVLVNAGMQLANITTLQDVFTPIIIGSLSLIGILPLALKLGLNFYQTKTQSL